MLALANEESHWDAKMRVLFPLGYGRPIESPQDSETICLGDIGVIYNGSFYKVFNALFHPTTPSRARQVIKNTDND